MGDLPHIFAKLKTFSEMFTVDEIKATMKELNTDMEGEVDFESFLRVSLTKNLIIQSVCVFS